MFINSVQRNFSLRSESAGKFAAMMSSMYRMIYLGK